MDILFYANANVFADLVRLETRIQGEAWKATPSHCAARFGSALTGDVFECVIGSGVDTRPTDNRDAWAFPVVLPNAENAQRMAYEAFWRHTRYGFDAVLAAYIGDRLPAGLRLVDDQAWPDCSLFVAHLLVAGGLTLPEWPGPPSPNDLLLWVQQNGK